jgi:hypothetical protein
MGSSPLDAPEGQFPNIATPPPRTVFMANAVRADITIMMITCDSQWIFTLYPLSRSITDFPFWGRSKPKDIMHPGPGL